MNQLLRTNLISNNILYIKRYKEEQDTNELIEAFILLPDSSEVSRREFDYEQAYGIVRNFTNSLGDTMILGELFKLEQKNTCNKLDIGGRVFEMVAGKERVEAEELLNRARESLRLERESSNKEYGLLEV